MSEPLNRGAKLALVISSLATGGAQRILLRLATHWADRGVDVTVITLATEDTVFELDARVHRIDLSVGGESASLLHALGNGARRVGALRRVLKSVNADIVVSLMDTTNVLTLLATRGLGVPVIACERIDPTVSPLNRSWRFLRSVTYPLADAVVVQTDRAAEYFPQSLRAIIRTIPNPIDLESPQSRPRLDEATSRRIVSVGRLETQKGFDLLLKAFAIATANDQSWRLEIWGDGRERSRLCAMATELGIEERLDLPGFTSNVSQAFRNASMFVLPSRFEGFPNVLCEAMAAGLPCIAFDCPSGPREILTDGMDGILVPPGDADSLAEALGRLMANPSLRESLGSAGRRSVERFSTANVMPLWNQAVVDVMSRARLLTGTT